MTDISKPLKWNLIEQVHHTLQAQKNVTVRFRPVKFHLNEDR